MKYRKLGTPIRCSICDAPSGTVQLQKVVSERLNASGYVCFKGDCAEQRALAMSKLIDGLTTKRGRR